MNMGHVRVLETMPFEAQNSTKKNYYWYSMLVLASFSNDSILRYVVEAFERIPFVSYFSGIIIPALYIFLVAMCLKSILANVQLGDILFILIFLIILLSTWIIKPENGEYIHKFLPEILLNCIPFYFVGLSIKINNKMVKWLYRLSIIALVINWAYVVYYKYTGRAFHTDSMYESYTMLLHIMIIVWYTMRKPTIVRFTFSIAGLLYLLSMGTRGPVVILISFVILYIVFNSAGNTKRKIFLIILLIGFSYIFMFTNATIEFVKWVSTVVESMGLSTRVFDSYLYNAAQDSIDERTLIYRLLWSALMEKPITGYGLFGEYPFIYWSAHNLYLQMCFEFGLIVGPLLIMLFIIISVLAIYKNSNRIAQEFALIWICYILVQGFFGGNVISFYVFFTLGYFVQQIRQKNISNQKLNTKNR
jgi:O-antigen ligase